MRKKRLKKGLVSFIAACAICSTMGVTAGVAGQSVYAAETEDTAKAVVIKEYKLSKKVKGTKANGKKVKIFDFSVVLPEIVEVEGNEAAGEKISACFSDLKKEIKKEFQSYKVDAAELFKQVPGNFGKNKGFYQLSYEYGEASRGQMYSVLTSATSYMMGAHGGFIQAGWNFDVRTGDVVTLDQILPFKTNEKVRTRLIQCIKDQVEEEMGQNVLFDDLNWDDFFGKSPEYDVNFTLIDGKVTLIFNQYDIAPYAAGTIYIELDETMEDCFTEYGKELLGNL